MNFSIEIASVPERDGVVAETWWGDAMVAELHRAESRGVMIDVFPTESNVPWTIDLADFLATIEVAHRKLG